MGYVELQVTTHFRFLSGTSHPEEMVEQASTYGYRSVTVNVRDTLAGIVSAHTTTQIAGIRLIPACTLDPEDGPGLLAFPTDIDAYARLSNLLTTGNLRTEKGKCLLYKADVYSHLKGSKFIVVPPATLNDVFDFDPAFKNALKEYRDIF